MKKLLTIFSFLFLFLFLFKTITLANFACTPKPTSVQLNQKSQAFTITSADLAPGNYDIYAVDNSFSKSTCFTNPNPGNCLFNARSVPLNAGVLNFPADFSNNLSSGDTITIYVFKSGTINNTNTCDPISVTVAGGKAGGPTSTCSITLTSSADSAGIQYSPYSDISLNAVYSSGSTGDRRIQVRSNDQNGPVAFDQCATLTNNQLTQDLGSNFSSGTYYVQAYDGCNLLGISERPLCNLTFVTSPTGGGVIASGTTDQSPPPVCAKSVNGKCLLVATGFGFNIGTDTSSFVQTLLGIILGLAGSIAVILIIISGYRLIASQGNPEKIVAAREQLTAAIVGLLFVIFSLFILQVIGVDILNLPGFGK